MSIEALALDDVRRTASGPCMGSRWSAIHFGPPDLDAAALATALQAAVELVEAQMSTWRPTSDLERLNAAPIGDWVAIPRDLATVLAAGLAIGRRSGGAFDIGVGDLVRAWGFGGGARVPDPATIAAIGGRASFDPPQTLQLDETGLRARRLAPLRLDLSAIAKGYGVDELARVAADFGLRSFLVGIDGEMRAGGAKPDGSPWIVGHEAPNPQARELGGILELIDAAVATSGDYRKAATLDGRRVSHTMDPATGEPAANDLAAVTVVAESCMIADAWATALLVSGAERGATLARDLGLHAIFVRHDGTSLSTFAD